MPDVVDLGKGDDTAVGIDLNREIGRCTDLATDDVPDLAELDLQSLAVAIAVGRGRVRAVKCEQP